MSSFNKKYAAIYDILYSAKDYGSETRLILDLIKQYKPNAKKILDYGCGTGNYDKGFLAKGYEISGIDLNDNMLSIAKQKFRDSRKIRFYNAKKRNVVRPGSIDVCVTLFDVLSYMNTNAEINSFTRYLMGVLNPGGLFIFDFWYGPGVIHLKPEQRRKEYAFKEGKIIRLTTPLMDLDRCLVKVAHTISIIKNGRVIERFVDPHSMRFFFRNEIEQFMDCHGFKLLKFGTWQRLDRAPSVNDWSALAVAKLVK